MRSEIRLMQRTHLSVETSLEAIENLLDEMDKEPRLSATTRRALQRHCSVLLRRFVEHATVEEHIHELTQEIMGGGPPKYSSLDGRAEILFNALQDLQDDVIRLPDEISTGHPSWKQVRRSFVEILETFQECIETDWSFYSAQGEGAAAHR